MEDITRRPFWQSSLGEVRTAWHEIGEIMSLLCFARSSDPGVRVGMDSVCVTNTLILCDYRRMDAKTYIIFGETYLVCK